MLGLFSRARRLSRSARPSFRPALERLEERDCPTTLSLGAMVLSTTKTVQFYGAVANTPQLAGLTVQLSGVAGGSAVTAADGSFSVSLTASSLGVENAAVLDASATYQLTDPNAPLISMFESSEFPGGYYRFNGHVNGMVFDGEVITFSGSEVPSMKGKTAVVNSNGDFSFVGHLLPGEAGDVYATATADAWGVNNTAVNDVDQSS